MAKTTCKKFTYAKYSSGGDGSAMAYTGGKMLTDYLAKVDINEERAEEEEYADGHKIDSEKIATGVSMAMELVNNDDDIRKDVLGMATGTDGELLMTEADPPFVGAGCIMANRHKGVTKWEAIWIYKIQFTTGGVSAETRRKNTTWQHETINGAGVGVQLSSGGVVCFYAYKSNMETETAAEAWLKGHAGITTQGGGGGSP